MDLNHLELPASLIADLYKNSFVEINEAGEKKPPEQPAFTNGNKYPDGNKKNILIIVNYAELSHLPDQQLAFLTNMLSACKVGINDVAIINLKNYSGTSYKNFLDDFKSKIIFMYGI